MGKASQYIILCEDKLQDVFVSRFLKKFKVSYHEITTIPYPAGYGCGENHVRENYPDQIKAYRAR